MCAIWRNRERHHRLHIGGDGLLHRAIIAILCVASSGCAPTDHPVFHAYSEGPSRVCFPERPAERRAHEGPFAKALIVHATVDGARYEFARFDLPKPLTRDKRRTLMRRVEQGLRTRPDIIEVESGTIVANGIVARVLSMRLLDQRMGVWHLSFPTPQQMLQASVVGPVKSRDRTIRFLASVGRRDCTR